ncbi:hypothetical protein FACS18945_0560 [Bacteroidia bacterium]|nr:hypothetical protein FACS18945_0560 [Bacteroidia bacterium]
MGNLPKISSLYLANLPNETHFQFMRDVQQILDSNESVIMAMGNLYPLFDQLLAKEDVALEKMRKSTYTATIEQLDKVRDALHHAIGIVIKGSLNSPNANIVEAARELKIVYDNYGSVANRTLTGETAVIFNLVQDLSSFPTYQAALGITALVTRLGETNDELNNSIAGRDGENTDKAAVGTVPEARAAMDEEYQKLVAIVQAAALTAAPGDAAAFIDFINHLNTIIARYKKLIKKHSSNNGGETGETEEGGEEEIIEEDDIVEERIIRKIK